jgi:DNA modification methylase
MFCVGDCLELIKSVDDASIQTVYMDPPFDSGRDYKMSTTDNTGFTDTWKGDDYKQFIESVINLLIPKLKKHGTLFFHISAEKMFVPESILRSRFKVVQPIFWKKCRSKNNVKNKLGATIDIIFKCSMNAKPKFNLVYQAKNDEYLKKSFKNIDERGNYSLGHLVTEKTKEGYKYEFEMGGINFNPASGWRIKVEELQKLKDDNRIHIPSKQGANVYKKIYLTENPGKPCTDLWDDIHSISQGSEERKYPTEKPVKLLERIINISTDEDDIVLDPMCGSGTTGAACKTLNRKYIMFDKNDNTEIIRNRLHVF